MCVYPIESCAETTDPKLIETIPRQLHLVIGITQEAEELLM
jgi:hypothetical protein